MDFDILIFGGQSNMQGTTESLPDYNPEIKNTLEYRCLSDEFIPLKHPVGENIGEGLLFWASEGHGSLVPDFCNTYQKLTGKNDDDFIILTDVCKDLSRNPEYINPFCEGHYNNKAMTIIGNTAGEALAKL